MLPASAPLVATPRASEFYSLSKEEDVCGCVCVWLCVWQVGGSTLSQQALTRPLPPTANFSISQKAHLDFQLSDLLASLSDIGAVKLSAGLHFMTGSMIIFLLFFL